MLFSIFLSLFFSFLLIIWFDTNAFFEYAKLLKLNKIIVQINNYKNILDNGVDESDLNFCSYLSQSYYNSFFIRLITCPVCLTTWFGILSFLLICPFLINRLGSWLGLIFSIFYIMPVPYLSLFFYKIYKKLN